MAPVLNLNNEVVKMRKDVKKARVLTIRRLTRHIGKLKSKKGSEDLKLKNQKRVERLIEEIRAMKEIKPEEVTRLALRTEVNFESVCKKGNGSLLILWFLVGGTYISDQADGWMDADAFLNP